MVFILAFHFKLRTIDDTTPCSSNSLLKPRNWLIAFLLTLGFIAHWWTYIFIEDNILPLHIYYLANVALFTIVLPKYYISQIPSLKLYVGVYHHHPPPVLPWQIPENFNPNFVNLVVVQYQNWIYLFFVLTMYMLFSAITTHCRAENHINTYLIILHFYLTTCYYVIYFT